MTTDTRSPAELPDTSDPADRKAVLARALLRNAFHVLCPDVDPRTEHRAKLSEQRLLRGWGEIRRTHHVQHNVIERQLHHLQLLEPRYRRQRALHERHARHHRTVASLEIVRDASRDPLHERQAAPAGAAAGRRHADILYAIADERHAAVKEIRNDDRALLPRGGRGAIRPQEFDVEVLDVQVHALVPLAFAADQTDLFAAVAVRDLAAERRFDDLAFVRQQHHGSGNDAPRPQIPHSLLEQVAGEHVQRMRVPEENFWLLVPPAGDEILDRPLVEVDRIEIDEAVDE